MHIRYSSEMSQVYTKHFVVRPQDLNHAGTLFGGTLMAHADEMAYVAASLTYPGCTFVTKVFQEFNFISGAVEGDIIKTEAKVLSKGRSSVQVSVTAVNALTAQEIFHTNAVLVNARHGKSIPISEGASHAMREISEEEAFALAGESECPVLKKEEAEEMDAAVCLKQFPGGYVLGISDKIRDLRIWFTADLALAEATYERYASHMREHGSPYGG